MITLSAARYKERYEEWSARPRSKTNFNTNSKYTQHENSSTSQDISQPAQWQTFECVCVLSWKPSYVCSCVCESDSSLNINAYVLISTDCLPLRSRAHAVFCISFWWWGRRVCFTRTHTHTHTEQFAVARLLSICFPNLTSAAAEWFSNTANTVSWAFCRVETFQFNFGRLAYRNSVDLLSKERCLYNWNKIN